MRLILVFLLTFIFLLPISLAQEAKPRPLIPYEEVYVDEPIFLKLTLVDSIGKPVLGGKVKVTSDFFSIDLYDDGMHNDSKANDGVYANAVIANASPGTYVITYTFTAAGYSDSIQAPLKIISKPFLDFEKISYIIIIVIILVITIFFLYKKLKGKAKFKNKIKQLELEKENIMEMMKKAEKDYYNTLIDKKTFMERVEKYKQQLNEIELKLKSLKK